MFGSVPAPPPRTAPTPGPAPATSPVTSPTFSILPALWTSTGLEISIAPVAATPIGPVTSTVILPGLMTLRVTAPGPGPSLALATSPTISL